MWKKQLSHLLIHLMYTLPLNVYIKKKQSLEYNSRDHWYIYYSSRLTLSNMATWLTCSLLV